MKTAFNRRTVILAAALGAGTTLLQACGGGDDEPQRNIVELAKNTSELSILEEAGVCAHQRGLRCAADRTRRE